MSNFVDEKSPENGDFLLLLNAKNGKICIIRLENCRKLWKNDENLQRRNGR